MRGEREARSDFGMRVYCTPTLPGRAPCVRTTTNGRNLHSTHTRLDGIGARIGCSERGWRARRALMGCDFARVPLTRARAHRLGWRCIWTVEDRLDEMVLAYWRLEAMQEGWRVETKSERFSGRCERVTNATMPCHGRRRCTLTRMRMIGVVASAGADESDFDLAVVCCESGVGFGLKIGDLGA